MENTREEWSADIESPLKAFNRRRGTPTEQQIRTELVHVLRCLEVDCCEKPLREIVTEQLERIGIEWKKRGKQSEIAMQGLLLVLEFCMSSPNSSYDIFELLIVCLGFHSVQFWRVAVPVLFESDFSSGTKYRDALLFALTLYDVNTGKNRLKELYAAVPGVRESLLGEHAKAFGERFHHLQKRMSRHASSGSISQSEDGRGSDEEAEHQGMATGLANSHFHGRVINVSNAPPVSLKKEKNAWEIKQGSGGLVSCVDPIMSKHTDNVWLANLGMNLREERAIARDGLAPATNTLGLPLIKQNIAEVLFHVLAEEEDDTTGNASQRKAREDLSLLGVLNSYNKGRYKLNPVVVQSDDYDVYYGGISNGLLWPALHNLPEYIAPEYDNQKVLTDHWCAYVRVNYQFAIDAVRNSRPQDFIWIHDYHLMLVGLVMMALDPNLEIGFFLHIPFQPPDDFFEKFSICGLPLLRALIRFTKVGFQTHRDRDRFVKEVETHIKSAKITFDRQLDIYAVSLEGATCNLGVFPVSIKNDDFLQFVDRPETRVLRNEIRRKILGPNPAPHAKLFFSVERFDYTKGIGEKLRAYERYLEKYPSRQGQDVLYQIAVTNRRSVDTYRLYQDHCLALAEDINKRFRTDSWTPIVFETDGLPRHQLVAAYLAMDVGVVTPRKDGMNLVAKEMIVVNPLAGLILSTGAGSEIQFHMAGLYEKDGLKNYTRIEDLYNPDTFADGFYEAATKSDKDQAKSGKILHDFLVAHDIEKWSAAFLDPSWTHHVIRPVELKTLDQFFGLLMRTRNIRRQIVDRVLKGVPIRQHFAISLTNARDSLRNSCSDGKILRLSAATDSPLTARFDISDELRELDRDLSFIQYVESDDPDNVEQFVTSLFVSEPEHLAEYSCEVTAATSLLTKADHFFYFFTDRDGTLKSYSCSYAASIQPAYSGVIQAQFARRCAQTCAIVTTAPLLNMGILDVSTIPEGFYYFGASGGREWYIDPVHKFKDNSIPEADLNMLDEVFIKLSLMLEEPDMHCFAWIGSGLQKHYGHVTIAHQDVHLSVPEEKQRELKEKVHEIVSEVDRYGNTLTIVESTRDMKCVLKARSSGTLFHKGNGIRLLCEHIHCDLRDGNILVCGDSETDLPMLEHCLKENSQGVYTIWVTTDASLRSKVHTLCAEYSNQNVEFVSCPEVVLAAMAHATIRETCRPRQY